MTEADCMLFSVCTSPLAPDLKMVDEEKATLASSLGLTVEPIPTGKVLIPYFLKRAAGALTESLDGPWMMQ